MRKEKTITPEGAVIRVNMARSLIENRNELARRTGIDPQRIRVRFLNPGSMRIFELRAIINETDMPDEDILKIVKGGKE